ncbi:MAG: hypothetical protein CVU57_20000 [Deltaproteobacteria bacterium HGW-Deltaproteobacteria-15]|nr:MAG: hypothetical protein CVU57_20000 [Deltaproteobacteria bacterium HGW-Deltaproteobacteria-15]
MRSETSKQFRGFNEVFPFTRGVESPWATASRAGRSRDFGLHPVMPAEAGIQSSEDRMDSRLRGNDGE